MEEKELHRLKRSELLEILLAQSQEIDNLRAQLAEKEKQLEERRIAIERSGSLAEASLQITHIFSEAQLAADTYVANVRARAASGAAADVAPSLQAAPPRTVPRGGRSRNSYEDDDDDVPRGRHAAHAKR